MSEDAAALENQTLDAEAEGPAIQDPVKLDPMTQDLVADPTDPDLGFGSLVANTAPQRLLNRDGSFNVRRKGLAWRHVISLYYLLLSLSWPRFLALFSLAYLALNGIFGLAYYAAGPGTLQGTLADHRFLQAYFFSVETISTVGYGNIAPISPTAHVLVTLEIMVGLFGVALVAGIVFARFSRPKAEVVFSRNALIAPYQDGTALMFRIANLRRSQIIEVSAKVIFSRFEVDEDGHRRRHFYDLPLERRKVTFFPLSWTVVHPIDGDSPLEGLDESECTESQVEVMVLLTGIDEGSSQTVHARSSYIAPEIVWGARFNSILELTRGEQVVAIDVDRIHEWEAVAD